MGVCGPLHEVMLGGDVSQTEADIPPLFFRALLLRPISYRLDE